MPEHRNHNHENEEIMPMLRHLHEIIHLLLEKVNIMSAEMDRLKASVAALTSAEKSLVALVKQLAQMIRDNATDPAALAALADEIDADSSEIAAAVTENTPQA